MPVEIKFVDEDGNEIKLSDAGSKIPTSDEQTHKLLLDMLARLDAIEQRLSEVTDED